MLFFYCLNLACLWKKVVFIFHSFNNRLLYFNLHIVSSSCIYLICSLCASSSLFRFVGWTSHISIYLCISSNCFCFFITLRWRGQERFFSHSFIANLESFSFYSQMCIGDPLIHWPQVLDIRVKKLCLSNHKWLNLIRIAPN